ncbi:MAG: leucine--tRNA ligase [Candidatus Peribacteraceae bacterium]|nr:leucine--tRNA ligase [Candidatus Peribacteraceae bacterium]
MYDSSTVEKKWQAKWEESKSYEIDLKKAKDPYYCTVMFPYPSGAQLHVGHWYQYSIPDSYCRYKRMCGKDVFHPMGFDAFGLPAENYAIKTGVHPAESISENVTNMIGQYKRMGVMYDWDKSLNSSEPEYYKWTQWLFLKMFENDLAYRKDANVNWCDSCKTVLANEQCQEGLCERCDTEVIQKPMTQWYWKITNYSDRLLDGHEKIDWPNKTIVMQKNWIGRKYGIDITYSIEGSDETVTCFTTRPDTNFGATFIVLAPEHSFTETVSESNEEVREYAQKSISKTELERQEEGRKKTGVFTGFYAVNNLNGAKMPIWVSDFVLGGFGTGAVVGVPGHDMRDFEFATQFDLPIVRVVVASDGDTSDITSVDQVQEKEGTMVNSEFLDGMEIMKAKEKIMDHLEKEGWGKKITTYRLRDWSVSRQRYWGAPIPIVYDPEGNPHPIPEEHLPWELPRDVDFKPTGTAPLAQSKELVERTEKIFGKDWKPEVDTMDTFVCSSFYQFRYLAEGSQKEFVPKEMEKKWMPMDLYIGGPEHACMHLIYARFVSMVLHDLGYVSVDEPFAQLVHQGLVTNNGAKMSKSKGNVVSPDEFVEKHGSDVFRLYLMFMGPFRHGGDWSDTGINGTARFVQRVWKILGEDHQDVPDTKEVEVKLHQTIKKVTEDIEKLHFNTCISALMELLNLLEKQEGVSTQTALTFAKLLSPLSPHLAEELWEKLGGKDLVIDQSWPSFDEKLCISDTATVAVQINGKLRGTITIDSGAQEADVIQMAKQEPNVAKFLEGQDVKKEIYIQGKMVSLVV